jgi:hypothetical protein
MDDLFTEEEINNAFKLAEESLPGQSIIISSKDKRFNVDTRVGALICAGTPRPTTREQAEVNRKNANLPPLSKL